MDVPDEVPGPEPTGPRVRVIDYDSSSDRLNTPFANGLESDPLIGKTDAAAFWQFQALAVTRRVGAES